MPLHVTGGRVHKGRAVGGPKAAGPGSAPAGFVPSLPAPGPVGFVGFLGPARHGEPMPPTLAGKGGRLQGAASRRGEGRVGVGAVLGSPGPGTPVCHGPPPALPFLGPVLGWGGGGCCLASWPPGGCGCSDGGDDANRRHLETGSLLSPVLSPGGGRRVARLCREEVQ